MAEKLSMDQEFFNKLTKILEVNLENESFGVKELAKATGISRSQLHRKIHAYNGNSTSQFIREYRLQKAMALLQKNVATASEIAYRVGFSSPTYFNTCFKEFYGFPPGEAKLRTTKSERPNRGLQVSDKNEITSVPLRKLRTNRRWIIGLSIGIAIILIILASDYLGAFKDDGVTKTANSVTENSIAVLPFKNWSGDPDLEYISDGMTDAIINRLTLIKSLNKVVPFTSIIPYKNYTDKNIPTIASELEVKNILQGNVQFAGDQVKISIQLVGGDNNTHLWSHEYSTEWLSSEIFVIQAEIAEKVADNLDVKVTTEEVMAIKRIPTVNEEAYNLFLQGEYQLKKLSAPSLKNAIRLFEQAIALDSEFYEAYVGLAGAYNTGGLVWGVFEERFAWEKTKAYLEKALQINKADQQIRDQLYLGYFYYDWNFDAAETYYNEIKDIPGVQTSRIGFAMTYPIKIGLFDEAYERANQYLRDEPTLGPLHCLAALSQFLKGNEKETLDILLKADPFYTEDWLYLQESARLYLYLGEYSKFKVQLKRLNEIFPARPPITIWLNLMEAKLDENKEKTDALKSELLDHYHKGSSGSPAWFLALYYAELGQDKETFHWLNNSVDAHEVEMTWLREEVLLRNLRGTPQYKEIYKRVGFNIPPHNK